MHQMASFKGCRLKNAKPCPQLASPHPGIIRLNCSEPSSQPKQLKIDCIDRVDPLHLCEVKVYGEHRMLLIQTLFVEMSLSAYAVIC